MATQTTKIVTDPTTGQQFAKKTTLVPVPPGIQQRPVILAPGTQTTQVVHSTTTIPTGIRPVHAGQHPHAAAQGYPVDDPRSQRVSRQDRYFDNQRRKMNSRSRSRSPTNVTVNKTNYSFFRSRYQGTAKLGFNTKSKKKPTAAKPHSSATAAAKSHHSTTAAKKKGSAARVKSNLSDSSDEDSYDSEDDHALVGAGMRYGKKKKRNQKKKPHNPHRESLIGPHIQGDEHTVTVFKQLRNEFRVHLRTDNASRAFKKAIMVVGNDFEDVATPDESFTIHKILLDSYQTGNPVALHLESEKQKTDVVSRVSPSLHENKVAVDFVFSKKEPFFVSNGEIVSVSLVNSEMASEPHSDVFEIDPRVFSQQETSIFHVPMSLYNESLQHLYKKHRIPTAIALFSVQKERDQNSFSVLNVQVFLNMKPSGIPGAHLQISGYPSTSGVHGPKHTVAVTAVPQENNTTKRIIHDALKKAFTEKNPEIALATNIETQIKDADFFVHWGEMTGSLVAYAVIQLLMANKDIHRLNDPLFLSKILSVDEIGNRAVEEIIDIKSKLGVPSTSGESSEVHLFPSLLQLLSHTSGLQNITTFTLEHALQMYEDVISNLRSALNPQSSPASDEPQTTESPEPSPVSTTPRSVYDNLERQFVESLRNPSAPLNPENAVIGDWQNSTEACLIAMFLTRYAQHGRFPEDIIDTSISRLSSSIQLKWGLSLDNTGRRIESPNNPYNLTAGVSSRRSDLVTFIKKLSEELTVKAATDSPFAIQLSNPIKTKGIPGHSHIAWHEDIVGSSSVIYTGATEVGVEGIIAFLIPDLDFWGVVVDSVSPTHKGQILDQGEIIDVLRETLYNVLKDNKIVGHSSFHRGNLLDNARYVRNVSEIEVFEYPKIDKVVDLSATYLSPFSDITARTTTELKFEPIPEYPTSRLRFKIMANSAQSTSVDLVLDHVRNGLFIIRPDGSVGEEVIITPDFVSLPGNEIFIRDSILLPKLQEYQRLVKDVKERAKNDIFGGPLSTVSKALMHVAPLEVITKPDPRDTPQPSTESTESQIGAHFGAFLGGAALGGLAAAGALALTRPYGYRPYWYGPYSLYGMYPATPFAAGTVWYGPGSPYGMYPPDLWFGTGSPYGLYAPAGLPSYVRWYGTGSPWGMRRPTHQYGHGSNRWGPRWYGPSRGYTRGNIRVGGHRSGGDGYGGRRGR